MSIYLNMIVKNEAHVIERCLTSVRDHVDGWVIHDTGSTDDTIAIIERVMHGIPGVLIEKPWVNFAHNRNLALEDARAYGGPDGYALFIDADEILDERTYTFPTNLTEEGYYLTVEYGDTRYGRLALARLGVSWEWEGAVHEFLNLFDARTGTIDGPRIVVHHDGARSRDPETYAKDAAMLYDDWARGNQSPRTAFYLAQSYRDAGSSHAQAWYQRRVDMSGGWREERWYAQFQLGILKANEDGGAALLKAYGQCPTRAEPLVALAAWLRGNERWHEAMMFARQATILPPPVDGLFVDTSVTWRAWDELATVAWYAGQIEIGHDAARRAAELKPDDPRVQANLAAYEESSRSTG